MTKWIIVVDDDTANLKMADHILNKNNMRVTALKSGSAFLEYVNENGMPDLVLLDIKMPVMDGYTATRYHSLVVDKDRLPDCLEITAWTENADGSMEEVMGLRHKTLPIEGVQFHPESVLTEHGHALLKNFLDRVR